MTLCFVKPCIVVHSRGQNRAAVARNALILYALPGKNSQILDSGTVGTLHSSLSLVLRKRCIYENLPRNVSCTGAYVTFPHSHRRINEPTEHIKVHCEATLLDEAEPLRGKKG